MATKKDRKAGRSGEESAKLPRRVAGPRALARRLCPHKTAGQLSHELVPAAGRTLTGGAARALAIDRVAAVVARTCEWGQPVTDWHVGDYRFLILEVRPRKGVCLYVQLWTEPDEPVLIEACSGAWNPAARPYVGPRQRAALRRLGYAIGGRARNYQKYWTLSPMADASALAGELLTILIDVFGYRANRAIGMSYCAEGRTEEDRVFPALAKDDVKRMLGISGCEVVTAEPVGPVSPDLKRRLLHVAQPFPFVVELRAQSGKTPTTYDAMRLITALPGGRGLPPEVLEMLVRECPFGRIFRDDEGDLLLVHDLLVARTTVRWFLMALHIWKQARERAVETLRLALASPAPGPARTSERMSGDGDPGEAGLTEDGEEGDEDDGDDGADGADGADSADSAGDRDPRHSRPARTVVH